MTCDAFRIWGDPFTQDESGRRLRALIGLVRQTNGLVGLCLTGARGDADGGRTVPLTNGTTTIDVRTRVEEHELEWIYSAASLTVASSAPLVVFGSHEDVLTAALEYPDACQVVHAIDASADAVLERVQGFVQNWPDHADPRLTPSERVAPFLALPLVENRDRTLLHVCGPDASTELTAEIFASLPFELGFDLRLHGADPADRAELVALFGERVAFVDGELDPATFAGVHAIVQPSSGELDAELLAICLASGRPLLCSRFGSLVADIVTSGFGFALGGRVVSGSFSVDPRPAVIALGSLAADPALGSAIARRARSRVVERLISPRPSPPPAEARSGARPLVVLEAPLFETSSSSHLTIETARALVRRDRVDVLLRPTTPFDCGVSAFAERAPELVSRLVRRPPRADLWLSAGWPVRASRPDAKALALRVDYEYGALPTELTPQVTDLADHVVVHSNAVQGLVKAAGTPSGRIHVIPHGVDGEALSPTGARSERVDAFARGRKVVLFVGGPVWRKGFDLVVGAALQLSQRSDIALVVKSVGARSDYAGFELSGLLDRMRVVPEAMDVLVLDENLSAAELAEVYRSADVLLHPYRGEGFGLPVVEARACGLPVVVTEGGSTDDFCDGPAVFKIPAKRRAVGLAQPHEGPVFVLEPDASEIPRLVLEALEPTVRREASAAAASIRECYTWDAAAAGIERLAHDACVRTTTTA